VTAGPLGPAVIRRARGYAPGAVAALPPGPPILALGADLKNTVTLVVDGQAMMSPHLGDLDHLESYAAFTQAVDDVLRMYALRPSDVRIVHDLHPQYRSTEYAASLAGGADDRRTAVAHHHAHIASVLAEHGLPPDEAVLGLALDGTGYGTDGTIWGCELLAGSLRDGFERAGHLAPYRLPGGDAAARFPALCALGATAELDMPDLIAPPFGFPPDVMLGRELLAKRVRAHVTSSAGRLFDAVAALCGFTGRVTFEGQAAMWLEYRAEQSAATRAYPAAYAAGVLDVRELLAAVVADRRTGTAVPDIARAFHLGFAAGLAAAARAAADERGLRTIALSGGVWQNGLLSSAVIRSLKRAGYRILTNRAVPVNDGGISLGQAALAAFGEGRGAAARHALSER
jgi:hydrogenase maturation protein HypF